MKKTVNFASLYKLSVIVAAAIIVAGAVMLIAFGGGTFASYTLANLSISMVIKTVVAAVLVCALVLLYLVIRFRKRGVKVALFSTLGAVCSALIAFALCIICRAPLGNYTFAVVLFGVALSYITSVLFFSPINIKLSRKKNATISEDNYNEMANKAFAPMLVILVILFVILVGAFVGALIYGSTLLMLYALPTLLTALISVEFTLAFTCRLYAKKA